jgi:hypothetical protein
MSSYSVEWLDGSDWLAGQGVGSDWLAGQGAGSDWLAGQGAERDHDLI